MSFRSGLIGKFGVDVGLIAALAGAAAAFVLVLVGLGFNVDLLDVHREEAQAANALNESIASVADQTLANAQWDDAIRNTETAYDLPWVKENIGLYYTQKGRFDFVYLIDDADKPVFAARKSQFIDPETFSSLRASAVHLIASVRAKEARRGRIRLSAKGRPVLTQGIMTSDVARLDSGLYVLTATLLQPEFGTWLPKGSRSFMIVTGRPIDAKFLDRLGRRLLLTDVRLTPPSDAPAGARAMVGRAQIELKNWDGTRLASIVWRPQQPGKDLISLALLPILIGIGIPLALYIKGRRTSRRLSAALLELGHARDAADAASEHKTQFLATMSHEIRTPLNGVLATVQIMELHDMPADQRQRLGVVRQSGDALLTVINDILDLSKMEAGKLELEARDFLIEDLAARLQALYSPVAEAKGLYFRVAVAPEASGVWHGDEGRLHQIGVNLASNALKFTQKGGVDVMFARSAGGGLRLSVTDTGIGVAAEKADKMFEKFSQADASIARKYGGTGLGLSICRQLVELMGGKIWLTSELGQGTRVFVEAPLRWVAPREAAPRAAPAAADIAYGRILAADDNATNRQVLAAILDSFGLTFDLVEDGAAVLDAWRTADYDAILMDIQMPVMDGIAATRMIRMEEAATRRRRTPIIALTADAMSQQVAQYSVAGMDAFVAKPILIGALQAALVEVFSQSEAAVDTPPADVRVA